LTIMDVEAKIQKVEAEIGEVKSDIKKVEGKIDDVEKLIKKATDDKERERLRDEKKQLCDEKKQLRDKENKLLDMANKLLDEKKLLLEQAAGGSQVGLASPLFAMRLMLERHRGARGFRRSLFQWGGHCGAYFNPESDVADFEALPCDGTENSRLLKIDLVFEHDWQRTSFINEVAKTVALGWEEALVRPWPRITEGNPKSLDHALKEFTMSRPSQRLHRVTVTDYVPRGVEAEPPADSPDPDGGTESSRSTKRVFIPSTHPLCKRARIEAETTIVFHAYGNVQRAHIIPKCKCGLSSDKKAGVADLFWLAKLEHNFLPLTPNLHEAFDGRGKGAGTKTESQTVIAFQPLKVMDDSNDRGRRIPLRAWCIEEERARALALNLEAQAVVLPVQVDDRTLYVVYGSGVATYGSKATQVIPTNSDNVVGAIPLWPSSIDRTEATGFETLENDRMEGWEITWACLRWNFHAKICGEWHILPHPLASNDTGSALLTTHSTKERLQAANWIDQKMDESFRDALRTP